MKISVYTDGSCHTAHRIGAWAAIILYCENKFVLKGHEFNTTHQRMELHAVIQALHYIHQNSLKLFKIDLYTDSQYIVDLPARKEKLQAVHYITKNQTTLPNADLLKNVFELCTPLNISFIKVEGHRKKDSEDNFNREADMICRKTMRKFATAKRRTE